MPSPIGIVYFSLPSSAPPLPRPHLSPPMRRRNLHQRPMSVPARTLSCVVSAVAFHNRADTVSQRLSPVSARSPYSSARIACVPNQSATCGQRVLLRETPSGMSTRAGSFLFQITGYPLAGSTWGQALRAFPRESPNSIPTSPERGSKLRTSSSVDDCFTRVPQRLVQRLKLNLRGWLLV